MLLRVFCTLLFFATMASARVISWTAYSEESQAAADEAAIAGVARQISAQVGASTTVYHSETDYGSSAENRKTIQTHNSIRSEVFLKGLKVKKLPKEGKNFGSSASLDTDELTSLYRFKLAEIQKKVSELEVRAEKNLLNKQFEESAKLLNEISSTSQPYASIIEEMSLYTPVDASMGLKTRAAQIQDALVNDMRSVSISVEPAPASVIKLKNDEKLNIELIASHKSSALAGFTFLVEHNGKTLAEATTNSSGKASVQIAASKITTPPYEVTITPRIPLNIRKSAAIGSLKYSLQIEKPACYLKLSCSEEKNICVAIMDNISKSFGNVIESSEVAPTTVLIQAKPTRTLNQLTSYSISLSLSKGGLQCQREKTGTGRTREEAIANAIKKMELDQCQASLKICQ